jgi:glyoxylase-like metal-dependent hydrolase (beta-lactamase superfamily II)
MVNEAAAAAALRFQRLTDHFHYLASETGPNVGAFVSEDGVLLVDPVRESDLPGVLEALKRVTSKPVRWVVNTTYQEETWGLHSAVVKHGASFLACKAAWELSRKGEPEKKSGTPALIFGNQVRLFPGGVEVRLLAPKQSPPAGNVVVFIPLEKLLQVGTLFRAGSFPDFADDSPPGAALAWIDALKQVNDEVPLLKSAMPQPKPDPAKPPEEEKTLEELVLVLPATGPVSNLQEVKTVLDAALRIRTEVTRAAAAGRSRDAIVNLPSLASFRNLGNFEPFVLRVFDALQKK